MEDTDDNYRLAPFMGIYDKTTNILEGIGSLYRGEDEINFGYVNDRTIYMSYLVTTGNTHLDEIFSIDNGVVTLLPWYANVHFTYIILA